MALISATKIFFLSMALVGSTLAQSSEFERIKQRAEQGNAVAQLNLGLLYFEGKDVSRNPAEAYKWFKLAANQGDPKAEYYLAVMYSQGDGVPQDNVKSFVWYELAVGRGIEAAKDERGVVVKLLTSREIVRGYGLARKCIDQAYINCE